MLTFIVADIGKVMVDFNHVMADLVQVMVNIMVKGWIFMHKQWLGFSWLIMVANGQYWLLSSCA